MAKCQLEEEIKRHEQEEYEYEKWQLSVESIDKDHDRLEKMKRRFKQDKDLRVVQEEQKSTSEQLQKEIQGLKRRILHQEREDRRES